MAIAVGAVLSGCGGGGAGTGAAGSGYSARQLNKALLSEFDGAKRITERSETGVYAELATVKQAEKLRDAARISDPECLDAAQQWNRLPEVRAAPSALGSFSREGVSITHILLAVPEDTAKKAVATEPPKGCAAYQATLKDGTTLSYRLKEIDLGGVGEDSYAFELTTEFQDKRMKMYGVVYRDAGYLAMASILGSEAGKEILADFTERATAHAGEVLG